MSRYKAVHDEVHNAYVITFKNKPVAHVESELVRKGGIFRKPQYHWHVTNIIGAPRAPFITHKTAIDHAIKLHKSQSKGNWSDPHNPIKKIGSHIDELGELLWDSSRDPRFGHPNEQEKIQELSFLHAELVKRFNKHYGRR